MHLPDWFKHLLWSWPVISDLKKNYIGTWSERSLLIVKGCNLILCRSFAYLDEMLSLRTKEWRACSIVWKTVLQNSWYLLAGILCWTEQCPNIESFSYLLISKYLHRMSNFFCLSFLPGRMASVQVKNYIGPKYSRQTQFIVSSSLLKACLHTT